MRSLNLGILAHVDAGKTSLTERLLYNAGVIAEVGSVDDGSTQTDSLALERQRGITIKSAVVSFVIGDVAVNLIDTPGHPDFIAEVERVLSVLDGAVLVISAVEGVQAQTRVLMRTLTRLRIPTLIFVNKLDRRGARYDDLLREISHKLTPAIVPMGDAHDLGTRSPRFQASSRAWQAALADHSDELLQAFVDDQQIPYGRLHEELATRTKQAAVHPVYAGSAITGAGVEELTRGITTLLPAASPDEDGPPAGAVFKVERGPAGEKVAYVRMFSGTLRNRQGLDQGKVTAVSVFDRGSAVPRESVRAGEIGKLWGLAGIKIGDRIGAAPDRAEHYFAPPSLETVVEPRRRSDRGAMHVALTQLAEQDPLINLRQDGVRQEISVSLYGEVQKEVIQATLAEEYGLDVTFRETTTICVERVAGIGEAAEFLGSNPFLATVGLRVEPGTGVEFRLGVSLGAMPYAFFKAVEETVHETLTQGLHGWQVTDCLVTMTHSGYWPRQSHAHATFDKSMSSTAGDFRNLTPLVLMDALRQAGTRVCEPVHRFTLELPPDLLGTVLPALVRLGAIPQPSATGLEGEVPAARIHGLQLQLPTLTRGEGVLETAFDRYEPVSGPPQERPRTDHNPLDRKEYLLHVERRV
ncbi:elongation factor G [Nonomuraea sediminis]|uniref:elongation factor G n=1 Tax=Nonomuraea sediminis TaxID=2835864 RepID=UPI001BDC4E8B|nr:TetM/TetW/TetO/TetS family tetracycline resistance ribosomal protection protein [Nonomuraea sediminis]